MLLAAVYPPVCPICNKVLQGKNERIKYICKECEPKLKYVKPPRCYQCGKPVKDDETEYCYDCNKKKHSFKRGAAVWTYSEGVKNSIYQFKYKNKREYARFYGTQVAEQCGMLIRQWKADVLIPVPLHKRRERQRGYNQAELLAEAIGQSLHMKVDGELLIRTKNTMAQKELSVGERVKNEKNAFKVKGNDVKYRKVIIVDDIYTTGSTIDSCAKALKEAGVEEVYFVCLCIGKGF